MEPDIDYFPDLLSHGILEVVPASQQDRSARPFM